MNTRVHEIDCVVVEEEITFTLAELAHACRTGDAPLRALVDEGVLEPLGSGPADWVFGGASLRVARTALRLVGGLELNPAAAAVVLELLAEIEHLRSRLRRAGLR